MIYFLGGGNMARAIISGLVREEHPPIHVIDHNQDKLTLLQQQFGVTTSTEVPTLTSDDTLVLAVKPQDMQAATQAIKPNGALILSIAAGLSVSTLSHYLKNTCRIIRIMPNTPCQVGQGVSGLYAASGATLADRNFAESIIKTTGEVIWLEKESDIHQIVGICGSSPAYVFYLLEALQNAAIQQGFSPSESHRLSLAVFQGAISLAAQSHLPFEQLRKNVTSKGGTTHEAITTFEQLQVAESIQQGVQACINRSKEMEQIFARHEK